MKTLTALTVAAALAASVSVAGAQSSMHKPSSTPMPQSNSSTMGAAPRAGTMGNSKHMTVKGHGRFCSQLASGGPLDCRYASMAACEKNVKPGLKKTCVTNPRMGTMGAK